MLFRPLADVALARWARDHPQGYVVNADLADPKGKDPVLHRATCGLVTSPELGHHVDGRHVKVCALDFNELERWARRVTGKSLHPCGVCVP